MQALKKSVGAQPWDGGSDFAGDHSVEYGQKSSDGTTNWDATELSGGLRYSEKPELHPSGQLYSDTSYQPLEPTMSDGDSKPAATYEELRARNRGYSK